MGDHFTALADKEEEGRGKGQTGSHITEVPDPGKIIIGYTNQATL